MLDKCGTVRILDQGLAKLRSDVDSDGEPLTAAGQMMGTPDYMAPEQWEDSSTVDIRVDIYSLGCTLFCLLTGPEVLRKQQQYLKRTRASHEAVAQAFGTLAFFVVLSLAWPSLSRLIGNRLHTPPPPRETINGPEVAALNL